MPALEGYVGHPGGQNYKHDVALIQVMLRAINNKGGSSYVTFNYDGTCRVHGGTHKAIEAFQKDLKISSCPGKETIGLVKQGGETFRKMYDKLPGTHKDLMSLKGEVFVYLAGPAVSTNAAAVENDAQFTEDFRTKLALLIRCMHGKYKMVLGVVPKTGGRRTFDAQASDDLSTQTKAGPGESNHNWGNAADLGFKDLKWVSRRNGIIITDKIHLNKLKDENNDMFLKLWSIRNKLTTTLHKTGFTGDHVHIQSYNDSNVSAGKSLAKLLDTVGNMSWDVNPGYPNEYKCDYGLGDKVVKIGNTKSTATAIWKKTCDVSGTNLATALNQAKERRDEATSCKLPPCQEQIYVDLMSVYAKDKTPKFPLKSSDITSAQYNKMRDWLRKDFELAEDHRDGWVVVR